MTVPRGALATLILEYAREGAKDWKRLDRAAKGRIRARLNQKVCDSAKEIEFELSRFESGRDYSSEMFLPMPQEPPGVQERCFFLLRRTGSGGVCFELVVLCEGEHCLGFRFEPSGEGTHGYGHIQLCRRMANGAVELSGLPNWVPNSYPAFPLGTSEGEAMFLSMTTAVHGFPESMEGIVENMFQARPADRKRYGDLLRKLVGGAT